MKDLKHIFSPNKKISLKSLMIMVSFQIVLFFVLWLNFSGDLVPKPIEVLSSMKNLITEEHILPELITSLWLCIKSMIISTIISLLFCYLTVIPFFRPLAFIMSKLRFLSLIGIGFVFTLMLSSGEELKTWLMTFSISVFFTTSMLSVISSIPKIRYDYAKTMRFSEWETVWYIVIREKIEDVFEIFRQNFAISWMMLTMVEGLSRSEGGIGVVLLNQNKHLHLDAVFAIQIIILIVGIGLDYSIGYLRDFFLPHVKLSKEKK